MRSFLRTQTHKKAAAFIAIIAIALLYAAVLPRWGVLDEIEYRTWDWRLQLTVSAGKASDKVKLIEISQASLDVRNDLTWPWPRAIYAAVIKFLEAGGAKGAAFDMLYTEPSSYGPGDDKEFKDALRGPLPVVAAMGLTNATQVVDPNELDEFRTLQTERARASKFDELYLRHPATQRYKTVMLPILEVLSAADGMGNVNIAPDSDGVFRHYTAGGYAGEIPAISLPFALYDKVSAGQDPQIYRFMDDKGRLSIRFHAAHGSYDTKDIDLILNSYLALQNGEPPPLAPQHYKDAWVFIGVSAPGLMDLRPTPLDPRAKGVEVNATVLDNLLHGTFVKKVPAWGNLLFAVFFAGLAAASVLFITAPVLQAALVIAAAAGQILAAYYLALTGYWVLFAVPASALVLALLLAMAVQYQLEGRQHRFIKNAFKYYVSPSVIDQIVTNPEMLSLGGEKRELSIFFSDIVGFTSVSEKIEASKLVQLLNVFLSEMTEVILKDAGTVDKYVGDAIVAFWNAPLIVPDHAHKSVRSALNCQARLQELFPYFQKEFGVPIRMRVGVHTGVVNVGNFGSKERFNYTVVGDAANLASRLEGANKFFGTSTLISGSTHKSLKGLISSRKVADIQVVGKTEVISVYEPFDERKKGELSGDALSIYSEALGNFEAAKLDRALELFKRLTQDPVARVYAARLESDVAERNGRPWSPVWNLAEK